MKTSICIPSTQTKARQGSTDLLTLALEGGCHMEEDHWYSLASQSSLAPGLVGGSTLKNKEENN